MENGNKSIGLNTRKVGVEYSSNENYNFVIKYLTFFCLILQMKTHAI